MVRYRFVRTVFGLLCMLGVLVPLYGFSRRSPKKKEVARSAGPFILASSAFNQGGTIPQHYTCDGKDISPPLHWDNPPVGTQSFVLVCHDPDAFGGEWIHWIVFDIPGAKRRLEKQVNVASINAQLGTNSWGEAEYGGPCPPLKQHRYVFTLYALDVPQLPVKTKMPKYRHIKRALGGHVLGKTRLMGKYQRVKNK